jgi:hypothetical protein
MKKMAEAKRQQTNLILYSEIKVTLSYNRNREKIQIVGGP